MDDPKMSWLVLVFSVRCERSFRKIWVSEKRRRKEKKKSRDLQRWRLGRVLFDGTARAPEAGTDVYKKHKLILERKKVYETAFVARRKTREPQKGNFVYQELRALPPCCLARQMRQSGSWNTHHVNTKLRLRNFRSTDPAS